MKIVENISKVNNEGKSNLGETTFITVYKIRETLSNGKTSIHTEAYCSNSLDEAKQTEGILRNDFSDRKSCHGAIEKLISFETYGLSDVKQVYQSQFQDNF